MATAHPHGTTAPKRPIAKATPAIQAAPARVVSPAISPPSPPPPVAVAPPEALDRAVKSFSMRPGPGNPWPLYFVTLRSILFARKTPFLLLLLAIPCLLVVFVNLGYEDGLREYAKDFDPRIGPPPADQSGGLVFFQDMVLNLVFPALVPLVVLSFASATIREEVEAKTLPYLFMRPVYRNWLVLPKTLAIAGAVTLLVWVGLAAFWFTSVPLTEGPFDHFGQFFVFLWASFLLVWATTGIFTLLATLLKRAAIAILIYIFVWETFLRQMPLQLIKQGSLNNYAAAIARNGIEREQFLFMGVDVSELIGQINPVFATIVLILVGSLGILGALYVVSTRDYDV